MKTGVGGELERLYREQGDRIWRTVCLYAGDPEVASDAVAEAFAQALGRGDAIASLAPWIWRASFRIAAGELKRRSRHRPQLDGSYEMPEPAGRLASALGQLSPKQRAAVVLRYYGGYSQKEIGDILGMASSTVGVHLHRGRRKLEAILGVGDEG